MFASFVYSFPIFECMVHNIYTSTNNKLPAQLGSVKKGPATYLQIRRTRAGRE